ncbi:transcriptional regulator, Crp/Fnr family [Serratia sp. AS12]|nr:transcriptional regulator, Crp/Fnr family [Serratia plymuthica AS9]AEF51251.1 transcriptional regulator, Crp/Fnr family [Serratia sp. AS12]AEG28959.1 transcriptional regulator, Crp/Fnr family [Serratia sp. AS13]MBJ7889101.1 Crp/Fnr family transcriptional regulator [Serratia sp. PAMC26656]
MGQMSRKNAESIMSQRGWLSHMPESFRHRLFQHALLVKCAPGQVIFSPGDPAEGIYGFIKGMVIIKTAPRDSTPRLIDLAVPGDWTGDDGFMTGQPRRFQLVAQSGSWMMHVPLVAMEQMAAQNPNDMRAFGVISILGSDSLLRVVNDLQKKDVSARVASVLHRMSWATNSPVSLSQENISIIANTSRKQVNNVIQRFVEEGWIGAGYRSITVTNPVALRQHAEQDIDD